MDFGDGGSSTSNTTVSHTYAAPGQFLASLTVVDAVTNCADSFKQTMYYALPVIIGSDTLVCKGTPISLAITNNYVNPATNYSWNIAGDQLAPIPDAVITNYTTVI